MKLSVTQYPGAELGVTMTDLTPDPGEEKLKAACQSWDSQGLVTR